ncbi:MAG: DNA repair protein RadC [Methylacidiphilales bacterium]|nr:DNA repair protein RadC [Candidatus Methylacidiphilales bacterium]MDW8348748.1 DNA repair protein RadC [Verrucomicrobiae bacterium]
MSENLKIAEMAVEERPRERLASRGPSALSISELLAILLRTGVKGKSAVNVGAQLLRQYGSLEQLSRAPWQELAAIRGVGKTKAITLKAAFELAVRLRQDRSEPIILDNPQKVYDFLSDEMRMLGREEVKVILLNTRLAFMGMERINNGTENSSIVDLRHLLRVVLLHGYKNFMLVHNHPSGDPQPSSADIKITGELKRCAEILNLAFLDHIIIGSTHSPSGLPYYSFREAGRL